MCMVHNGDGYSLLMREARPLAKKVHKCSECRRQISVGERYYRNDYLDKDSGFFTHKVCEHCKPACDWLQRNCHGFIFGEVKEDIAEHAFCYDWYLKRSYVGSWRLARACIGMRRRWTKKNGQLMKVPEL